MVTLTLPLSVRENLARAKSYLNRNEPVRAIETVILSLEEFITIQVIGEAKFTMESGYREFFTEFNHNPSVLSFYESVNLPKNAFLAYARGKEKRFIEQLKAVSAGIERILNAKAKEEEEKQIQVKENLLNDGITCLEAGNIPQGRSLLKRYFAMHSNEEGVARMLAEVFLRFSLLEESADFFEKAIIEKNTDSNAYQGLIITYTGLNEFEKVENTYRHLIQQFGPHPRTLIKLAKFYTSIRKKDKAYTTLLQALDKDPESAEIKKLLEDLNPK